mmetsp:Transcript_32195/g.108399  ORF Transcript_32195/g.108399 Transcript_32195/m.108399 type:complete len:228 (-) Transcript_32195:1830-2513(-)
MRMPHRGHGRSDRGRPRRRARRRGAIGAAARRALRVQNCRNRPIRYRRHAPDDGRRVLRAALREARAAAARAFSGVVADHRCGPHRSTVGPAGDNGARRARHGGSRRDYHARLRSARDCVDDVFEQRQDGYFDHGQNVSPPANGLGRRRFQLRRSAHARRAGFECFESRRSHRRGRAGSISRAFLKRRHVDARRFRGRRCAPGSLRPARGLFRVQSRREKGRGRLPT